MIVDPAPKELGARIKSARQRAGLTQHALSLRVKVSRTAIVMLETGTRNPQPGEISRIAVVLGVPEGELWSGQP